MAPDSSRRLSYDSAMTLYPQLVHASVREHGARTNAERTYLETLQTLLDSQWSTVEMAEAATVLNPLLDARDAAPEEVDALAARILKAAQAVRDARSGMACDLALDGLRLALDGAGALLRGDENVVS